LHRNNSDFKNGHKPDTDAVNNEKGDLVTESHSILARWRNHFYHLLNAHGDNNIEHTAQPVPDPNAFEFRIALISQKGTNHQVLIKFRQNLLKHRVGQSA
jgi:hypothetical protein